MASPREDLEGGQTSGYLSWCSLEFSLRITAGLSPRTWWIILEYFHRAMG
jgi:hypothetical protein